MKTRYLIIFIILMLAAAIAAVLFKKSAPPAKIFDQSVSDGAIAFSYPSNQFSLAITKAQILVNSYIPPCDDNFNYCIYYNGAAYKGTNFDGAGVRIQKRTDLTNESACLYTAPANFDASIKPDSTKPGGDFSSSIFSNVGSAGAGHYAVGSLYRLYVKNNSSCYEFETRIGQMQFANYPPGAIAEFTAADMKNLQSELLQIISQVSLPSGQKVF